MLRFLNSKSEISRQIFIKLNHLIIIISLQQSKYQEL